MTDLNTLPPLLVPRPAQLQVQNLLPRTATLPSTKPSVTIDESLPHSDAYRLIISPPHITITHRSPIGLAFAHATLAQLRAQYAVNLPALEILDHPAIKTRGLMLDVSRDRIPTMDEFHRLIPQLAALKLNHLQLYTEHTFAYAGHEEVWQGWNPITPTELLEIQSLCTHDGIELVANQNCFGHLTHWLKHPSYARLAETHGDWTFDRFQRSGPFSLCPSDPGSIALVRDMLDQLLSLFDSPLVNIGCDETYDVGQGRSRDEVTRRGKPAVYFDFLDRVFDVARAHGKRPMFWADVALNHPESIHRIPDDAIALAWGYEAETDFEAWCATLTAAGKTAWFCPGTSSWRSITGRTSTRRANCKNAADAAAKHKLTGYLITDWGDAGHQQHWPIALIAIAEAADMAWNAGRTPQVIHTDRTLRASEGTSLARAISLHCFHDHSLTTADWLAQLGDIDLPIRPRAGRAWFEGKNKPLENASALFADLAERWDSDAIDLTADDFLPLLDRLTDFRSSLLSSLPQLTRDELTLTLDRTELAVKRAIARRSPNPLGTGFKPVRLLALATHIHTTHAQLWPHRSRPGLGLTDSLTHDQRIVDELNSL